MDAANMPQGLGQLKTMEEMLMGTAQVQGSNPNQPAAALAPGPGGALRGGTARPQKEKAIDCPRCNSTNTKFCYYNNYSVQQPRYLCKTCRRYWTQGGALRNVPVGGGSRKNKRHSFAASSSMAGAAAPNSNKNPKLAHDLNMNMALPDHHGGMQQAQAEYMAFPSVESISMMCNPPAGGGGGTMGALLPGSVLSAMELLRSTGFYIPLPTPMPAGDQYGGEAEAGFTLGEFRQPPQPLLESQTLLGFTQLDAHGSSGGAASSAGYGSSTGMQGLQETAGRLLFPFEGLKPTASSGGVDDGGHHQLEQGNEAQQGNGATAGGHDMPVFWNGMVGGGASW